MGGSDDTAGGIGDHATDGAAKSLSWQRRDRQKEDSQNNECDMPHLVLSVFK